MTLGVGACRLAETIGLAWAVGLLVFSSILCITLFFTGVVGVIGIALALIAALGGTTWLGRAVWRERTSKRILEWPGPLAQLANVAGGAMIAVSVLLASWFSLAGPFPFWDAWARWAFKARIFDIGVPAFHILVASPPDDPLNLPVAEAALWRLPDPLGQWLVLLLGPACLLALALLFYSGLARLYGRGTAALAAGTLTVIPDMPWQASYACADVPLALYAGASALYLLLWWRLRQPLDAMIMGFLAAGLVWTKREGMILAALLLLAYFIGELVSGELHKTGRPWAFVRPALPAVAVALSWEVLLKVTHTGGGGDYLPLTPQVFLAHVDRVPVVFLVFMREMLTLPHWSLFWVLLFLAVVLKAPSLTASGRALLGLLLGQLAIYGTGYVFSSWHPYTTHILSSLDRALLQSVPLAFLVLVEAVYSPFLSKRRL